MTPESANSADPAARKRGRPRDPGVEGRRRAEILAAAGRVFAAAGYAATDVQAIAAAAGVGKGTVYRYFKRKDDLFLAAVDHGLTDLAATCSAAVGDTAVPVLARLAGVCRAYLAFFAARPEMVELFVQERATFRGRRQALYFAVDESDPRHCGMTTFMGELFASGVLRPFTPDQFHEVVGDLLFGTVVANTLSGRPADPDAQAQAVVHLLFHGILARSPEPTA